MSTCVIESDTPWTLKILNSAGGTIEELKGAGIKQYATAVERYIGDPVAQKIWIKIALGGECFMPINVDRN